MQKHNNHSKSVIQISCLLSICKHHAAGSAWYHHQRGGLVLVTTLGPSFFGDGFVPWSRPPSRITELSRDVTVREALDLAEDGFVAALDLAEDGCGSDSTARGGVSGACA